MMQKEFYSNGKLLLSGEYAILDGALGLAIPTSYGQSLKATPINGDLLLWRSFDENKKEWFSAEINIKDFSIKTTSDETVCTTLINLLKEARGQNPLFLSDGDTFQVETHLNFPRSWGLGTSSTLINNLAQWARVDAYKLLANAFGGSGYDIACAQHNSPISYQLKNDEPQVTELDFDPDFKDNLFFVHLNQKQNSKTAIANYREKAFDQSILVSEITGLTKKMISAQSLAEFELAMEQHEAVLAKILNVDPIKQTLFSDYPGVVKSLGAWGGDFVMVTGDFKSMDYFKHKGYYTTIAYPKMVL